MDDLIVIILTLVFVVAGILGQFNKKKQPQNATGGEAQPDIDSGDNFWDFLEDDSEKKQEPAYVPAYEKETKTAYKPEPNAEKLKNEKMAKAAKKGTSVFENDLIKDKNSIKRQTKRSKKTDRFKLREAVIYSEILNRKYT